MNTGLRNSTALAIATAGMMAASAASGAVITWNYTATAEFGTAGVDAPTFTNAGANANANTQIDEISWGAAGGQFEGGAQNRSALTIGPIAPFTQGVPGNTATSGQIDTNGGMPEAGPLLTHFNNDISINFDTLDTATLFTSLLLTPSNPAGPAQDPLSIDFAINFIETPNQSGTCFDGSVSVCDDIFVLNVSGSDPVLTQTGALSFAQFFEFDGVEYRVDLFELLGDVVPLGSDACEAALGAGNTDCLGFATPEGLTTSAQFGFTVSAVPEPGILAMLGLGLTGLGLMRRRRVRA